MFDDLTIYIPTRGRSDNQATWSYLPESVRARTMLVADEDDSMMLDLLGYPVITHQEDNIGSIRQWVVDQHDVELQGKHILFLDDDLYVSYRLKDNPTKFARADKGGAAVEKMVQEYRRMLDHCDLAGISPRHMSNTNPEPYAFNQRTYKSWGVNVEVFRELGIRADRVSHGEDYDVFLQMLTKGRRMALLNTFITDDTGMQKDGGCSTYRTNRVATECSRRIQGFFPDYVRLVSKPLWADSDGEEHMETQVQWKKAYKAGVAEYGPEPEWPLTGEDAWYVG